MKCLRDLYYEAYSLLSRKVIENPKFDVELLMEYAFEIKRSLLITDPEFCVSRKQEQIFWKIIEKRLQYCPISKIIGKREFWSLDFIVDENVLDPRPDSETLISTVLKIYKNKNMRLKILDLGLGSGCLLITLMLHYQNSIGYAFEKELGAYRVAQKNILKYHLKNRIKMYLSSWNKCYTNDFDLIISNPPYIRRNEIRGLQLDVKLYDPITALDGGVSGFNSYFEILKIIKRCLKKNGKAVLEIGESQKIMHYFIAKYGLKFHYYTYDLSGKKRCIVISK